MMNKKKLALFKGLWGEYYAMLYLCLRGYRIVHHNWRCPLGEIDIIARRGSHLAMIEVKHHEFYDDATPVVSTRQQSRIVRATGMYLASHRRAINNTISFDAIVLHGWWRLHHIPNAWQ